MPALLLSRCWSTFRLHIYWQAGLQLEERETILSNWNSSFRWQFMHIIHKMISYHNRHIFILLVSLIVIVLECNEAQFLAKKHDKRRIAKLNWVQDLSCYFEFFSLHLPPLLWMQPSDYAMSVYGLVHFINPLQWTHWQTWDLRSKWDFPGQACIVLN